MINYASTANRFMETFAYVCIRQISMKLYTAAISNGNSTISALPTLDCGTTVALCRLSLSSGGAVMCYYSPSIVRSISINQLACISLFHCGVCCMLYGSEIIWGMFAAEAIRGGMYAVLWSGCTHHVQSLAYLGGRSTVVSDHPSSVFFR